MNYFELYMGKAKLVNAKKEDASKQQVMNEGCKAKPKKEKKKPKKGK